MENARKEIKNKNKKQNKNRDVTCAGKKKRQQNINGISNKETLGKELMNNKAKKKREKDYEE